MIGVFVLQKAVDDDNSSDLKDPQPDKERVKDDKWLVVMGICTHFGCVPMNGQVMTITIIIIPQLSSAH
jgi:Rieske Fe-S protein